MKLLLLSILGFVLLISCKKDKVPVPILEEPSKWEVIAGNYKVYDTLGTYLYDMKIVHVSNAADEYDDSLRFENFDGEFTFTYKQSTASNLPTYNVKIGVHDSLVDSDGNRWNIFSTNYENYNFLENDTIRMRFQKSNIQYYLQDLTPYFQCDCIQVAVKQ